VPRYCQDFKLSWLSGEVPDQLAALERAAALPSFSASHFGMVAEWARGQGLGRRSGSVGGDKGRVVEVCRAAEAGRLVRLTSQAPLDYPATAMVSTNWVPRSSSVPDCLRRSFC
jgi:hypothetical protein